MSGTGDDTNVTAYSLRTGVSTNQRTVNDDRLAQRYDGVEATVEKRYRNGFSLVSGYTYSRTRVDLTSLATPNSLINAAGESGGRRHQFKMTGSYMLPYEILFGGNFLWQSGLPFHRTFAVQQCSGSVTTNCVSQNNQTINAEPRGSRELGNLLTSDIRFGRRFRFGTNGLELSMDVYNVANANTTYQVRSTSTLARIKVNGDPTQPDTLIPSFMSPTGVLAPRIMRFNVTYSFGR